MNRSLAAVLAAVVVAAVVVGALTLARSGGAQPVGAVSDGQSAAVPEAGTSASPASAEEQARRDLDRLVREYYAAENAVYLDIAMDPTAALDPYLRNPASGARVADILTFRNERHRLDERTAEVHAVTVTDLDMAAQPRLATVVECHTLSASGVDGQSGKPAAFRNRRQTIWSAVGLPDGSWRLKTYDSAETGSC